MSRKITHTDLVQAITEEGRRPDWRSDREYAGRLWSRLASIDPDAAPLPSEVIDARVLEKAREVIARRGMGDPVLSEQMANQLAAYRDRLNGQ